MSAGVQASAGIQPMQPFEKLVWRKGERCERSYLPTVQAPVEQAHRVEQAPRVEQTPMQLNEEQRIMPDGFRQVSNKREEASAKMNERYLIGQSTQNPFLSSDYASDIEVQMNFLTPQKS